MNYRVISHEDLLKQARERTVKMQIPFTVGGQTFMVEKSIVGGEMELLGLDRPVGEMIASSDGLQDILRKVVLDVELGRESVPLLYEPIYSRVSDPNLPRLIQAVNKQWGVVVFTEWFEGQEIKMGKLDTAQGPTATLGTIAAAFEYTEDMAEWNETWAMEQMNTAMGEAYNAKLNQMHFAPILDFSYTSANQTAANATGTTLTEKMRLTFQAGLKKAAVAKRPPSILLAHSSRKWDIEPALEAFEVAGTKYKALSDLSTIIYYDGYTITVGDKTYTYAGVGTDKGYLIRPKIGFNEYVKHDLRVDADNADISRLIEAQIVGRSRRGLYAAIAANVHECTLPS